MNESITAENKKQNGQKPPLSWCRIAGEILAGTSTGLAVGLPVGPVASIQFDNGGCFGRLAALGMFYLLFPTLYGLGSAVGVYLVGRIGKQTGSFLPTLGCGVLGGLAMLSMFRFRLLMEEAVLGAFLLFTAPVLATLGFNSTRRHKDPPSS